MIDKKTIEEIRTGVDLKSYVESRGIALKQTGKGWMGLCPFHDEKTPSFTVSPTKQFYHCFGCGADGTALGFLMDHDHMDVVEPAGLGLGCDELALGGGVGEADGGRSAEVPGVRRGTPAAARDRAFA